MSDTLWIHYAVPRTAWYSLADDQKQRLKSEWQAVRKASYDAGASGGERFHIRGQSDYSTVEVWRFPDVEAALGHWVRLTDRGYAEWFKAANNVGLAAEGES